VVRKRQAVDKIWEFQTPTSSLTTCIISQITDAHCVSKNTPHYDGNNFVNS